MISKKLRPAMTLVALVFTLFALFIGSRVRADEMRNLNAQAAGTNLLVNPGFEGIGKPVDNTGTNPDNWTRDTFTGVPYGEIFTPAGWVTWWQEGEFKRPECKVIPNEAPFNSDPHRIYQGYYSGMCFTFFGKQNAGYYQVVRNIPPGSLVEGSFYAHAWACGEDSPPKSCGDPHSFYFRVGIDPNGGTDPFSSSIVWSAPYFHYDTFGYVGPVQATVGEAGAATLFIQAYGKWALKHNDAYFDTASLTLMTPAEEPTATMEPPPPTSEAAPTVEVLQTTPTARPDGAIVHTVVSGDTLFGIALMYDVDVQDIYDLNNLDSTSILSIGQEIVVSTTGDVAPTPTPTPEAEATEATPEAQPTETGASAEPGPEASGSLVQPSAGKAAVCVLAFYDANADMFRQPEDGEMLLPNAQVNLLARSGPVDTRLTDGISEPWCFENLDPGNYVLRHTPPSGYVLTDGGQSSFVLNEGQVLNLELAYTRDAAAADAERTGEEIVNPAPTEEAATEDEDQPRVTNVLNLVLRVSGFIVLALAIAVLVLFILSRRSA